jgi:hypothetical protein
MSTIQTWFWAAPLTDMLTKKANIDPAVRAKLDELGVDTVRSKLVWIRNVRDMRGALATRDTRLISDCRLRALHCPLRLHRSGQRPTIRREAEEDWGC